VPDYRTCERPPVIKVALANEQTRLPIDRRRLRRAARIVLQNENIHKAEISLAVVDESSIRRLNRQYLHHDQPTDVLSFLLDRSAGEFVGEVIVSADAALGSASQYGWPPADELLLYVVHGLLHLVGYEDLTRAGRVRMRRREARYMVQLGALARATRPPPTKARKSVVPCPPRKRQP